MVYAIIFTGAANQFQTFRIGVGAQFNSFPRQYRWSLARILTRGSMGQARPAVHTQQPQDAGEKSIMQTPSLEGKH